MENPDLNSKRADFVVLQPDNGRLEGQELYGFRSQVMGQIEETDSPKFLLNLKSLTYVDSRMLSVFLTISKACIAKGGQLVVSNVNSGVLKVFALTRMNRTIDIQEDADTFLDS